MSQLKAPNKIIASMSDDSRHQLAIDLERWREHVQDQTTYGLVALMKEAGETEGVIKRAERMRSWVLAYGLSSPLGQDGNLPSDLAAQVALGQREAAEDESERSTVKSESEQVGDDHLHVNVQGQALVMGLDDLVRVSGLDLDSWRVIKHEVNTWTTSMRIKKLAGHSPTGAPMFESEPVVVRNWQVKAFCQRRMDEGFKLPEFSVAPSVGPKPSRTDGKEVVLLIPDPQIGFRRRKGRLHPLHDRRALDVCVQIAERLQPDYIVWLGDNLDLAEMSEKFPCPAEMIDTAEPAIAELRFWMAAVNAAAPHAKQWMLEGNHEDRVRRKMASHLSGLAGVKAPGDERSAMDFGRLLGVDKLGVDYISPYKTSAWLWDLVEITHGEVVRGKSGQTVSSVVNGSDFSKVFGHIHRVEVAHRTKWGPGGPHQVFAATPGCLCRLAPGIMPGVKPYQNWQQGFGVMSLDLETMQESITLPTIHRGSSWWQASQIKGNDRTPEIEAQTGWPMASDWLIEGE